MNRNRETIEKRDICLLNKKQIKAKLLPQKQVWEIGPFEEKLASLQFKYRKGKMKRVELKSLLNLKGIPAFAGMTARKN